MINHNIGKNWIEANKKRGMEFWPQKYLKTFLVIPIPREKTTAKVDDVGVPGKEFGMPAELYILWWKSIPNECRTIESEWTDDDAELESKCGRRSNTQHQMKDRERHIVSRWVLLSWNMVKKWQKKRMLPSVVGGGRDKREIMIGI